MRAEGKGQNSREHQAQGTVTGCVIMTTAFRRKGATGSQSLQSSQIAWRLQLPLLGAA